MTGCSGFLGCKAGLAALGGGETEECLGVRRSGQSDLQVKRRKGQHKPLVYLMRPFKRRWRTFGARLQPSATFKQTSQTSIFQNLNYC